MATKRDYYDVLGVKRGSSEDEIRRAFRRLARQYHPDVNSNGDAEQRFKEINEAYEVLSDPERRSSYDRFGHDGPQAQGFGAGMGGFGFEDIFETFFGGSARTRSRRSTRASDLRYNLTLSFEEAVFGTEKVLEIPRLQTCPRCGGSGGEPGTQPIRCPSCNGTGEVRRMQQSIFGHFVNVTMCDRCRGEGEINPNPCAECRGQGRVRTTQRLSVTIPAGVDDGQQIRLAGEGEGAAAGGVPGDLYVFLSVTPHPLFKRQGSDLIYEMSVNVAQAALGDEAEVPTVDGTPVRIKVPSGTQTGKILRLREHGVPHLRGSGRGDQLIRVRVVTPQDLTDEQRRLFQELARTFQEPRRETGARKAATGQPSGDEAEGKATSANGTAGDRPKGPKGQASGDGSRKAGKREKGLFDKVKDVFGGD